MQTTGGAALHRAPLYGCLEMSVQKKRISTCAQEEYREYVCAVAEEDKYCYFLVAWATSLASTRNIAEPISSVAGRRRVFTLYAVLNRVGIGATVHAISQ